MPEFSLAAAKAEGPRARKVDLGDGDFTYCRDGLTAAELCEIMDAQRLPEGQRILRYFQILLADGNGARVYPSGSPPERIAELSEYPARVVLAVIQKGASINGLDIDGDSAPGN